MKAKIIKKFKSIFSIRSFVILIIFIILISSIIVGIKLATKKTSKSSGPDNPIITQDWFNLQVKNFLIIQEKEKPYYYQQFSTPISIVDVSGGSITNTNISTNVIWNLPSTSNHTTTISDPDLNNKSLESSFNVINVDNYMLNSVDKFSHTPYVSQPITQDWFNQQVKEYLKNIQSGNAPFYYPKDPTPIQINDVTGGSINSDSIKTEVNWTVPTRKNQITEIIDFSLNSNSRQSDFNVIAINNAMKNSNVYFTHSKPTGIQIWTDDFKVDTAVDIYQHYALISSNSNQKFLLQKEAINSSVKTLSGIISFGNDKFSNVTDILNLSNYIDGANTVNSGIPLMNIPVGPTSTGGTPFSVGDDDSPKHAAVFGLKPGGSGTQEWEKLAATDLISSKFTSDTTYVAFVKVKLLNGDIQLIIWSFNTPNPHNDFNNFNNALSISFSLF